MDDTLLEKSHIAGIQALKLQRAGLYELAVERHLEAAELLAKLQAQLPDGNALVTNLNYFITHHKRQAHLDEVIVNFKNRRAAAQPSAGTPTAKSMERPKTDSLSPRRRTIHAPHRVFEEPDSLLPQALSSNMTKYTVRPKSDSEIIEEYKMMIENLKTVVAKQAEELMEARKKAVKDEATIRELKQRLEKYESSTSILNASQYVPAPFPELPPLEHPPDCDY